jgi:AbrB family looped-hinge helix DNA binding protein
MSEPITLQIAQRGIVTLPKALRDTYHLQAGDTLTLIDLDGVFVLSPRRLEVDRLADQIAGELGKRGETLESMLNALRESREQYGQDA